MSADVTSLGIRGVLIFLRPGTAVENCPQGGAAGAPDACHAVPSWQSSICPF